MDRLWTENPQLPARLPTSWARPLAGLALFILALAVMGGYLYEGWHRVAYVTAFGTMAAANLAWAAASLLPPGPAARRLLVAVSPLAIVMMLALGASLAFMVDCGR